MKRSKLQSLGGYKFVRVEGFPKNFFFLKKSPYISVRHQRLYSEMLHLSDVKLLMPTGFGGEDFFKTSTFKMKRTLNLAFQLDSEYNDDIQFIYHL